MELGSVAALVTAGTDAWFAVLEEPLLDLVEAFLFVSEGCEAAVVCDEPAGFELVSP